MLSDKGEGLKWMGGVKHMTAGLRDRLLMSQWELDITLELRYRDGAPARVTVAFGNYLENARS